MAPTLLRSTPPRLSMRPWLLFALASSASTPCPPPRISCRRASSRVKPSSQLQKRDVAGSFIFRLAEDSPDGWTQVALFRRSAKVRTYQHKWAPVSGTVEASDADPLATAWRELAEETGLTPDSLRFLRRGKPYSYSDASIGREWTINPFAFILQPGAASTIRLDWEHEAYDWFNPVDLLANRSFQGVPHLTDSLRRVWFELELGPGAAAAALESGLRDLRGDGDATTRRTRRGPLLRALKAFLDVLAALDAPSTDRWWRNLRLAAWHLSYNGTQPMDPSVLSTLVDLMTFVEAKLPSGKTIPASFADDLCAKMRRFAQDAYRLDDDGVEQGAEEENEDDWEEREVQVSEQQTQKQEKEQETGRDQEQEPETEEIEVEIGLELEELWDDVGQTRAERFFSDL
ncbi:NUDIX domain-containing protein [Hirsutella rhossiliensis]|uniref:NUDIX domain-containing protein n=1 Tax=Hirsutella rhossiliensis TaxID=111463 RepID=A0A9P8MP68_9HYPO|nr:NUDIX domain-containing protein [Hirsutella rhossiliensis]KAH0958537.1 NUDIX domain-containing protein [Hirsutella rhossiliensis]